MPGADRADDAADAAPVVDDTGEGEGWSSGATPRWWGWAAFLLSLAGFADAFYLTLEHFSGASPVCPANSTFNCLKVTTSPESYLFGIPVALLGLLFFTAMVVVNLPPLWRTGGTWATRAAWARLALTVGGMGFVLWLVYAEIFLIKAVCLWCTGVHVLTLVLFVLVIATFSPLLSGAGGWEE